SFVLWRLCSLLAPLCSLFFLQSSGHHRALHSFPTRRSSDLWPSGGPYSQFPCFCLSGSGRRGARPSVSPCAPGWPSSRQRSITRSEEHTSELQSRENLVCRLLLEKKKKTNKRPQRRDMRQTD